MEICYILDASAFINGFKLNTNNNFTIPEITAEIKDFQSRLALDMAIDECKLTIQDVPDEYTNCVNKIISESGDILRLSLPDKKLISLAYMFSKEGRNVKVISDDYTIQETELKGKNKTDTLKRASEIFGNIVTYNNATKTINAIIESKSNKATIEEIVKTRYILKGLATST